MLSLISFAMHVSATVATLNSRAQMPLRPNDAIPGQSGGSIVELCSESSRDDLLVIERMFNQPQKPYMNDEVDVFIWGNFVSDIPLDSTVDYQINVTASTGDFGALNGTFQICDYLEKMHQPPRPNEPERAEPERACPPRAGPVFIDYAAWFADWLVAPGNWSVKFDARDPDGRRIFCIRAEFDLRYKPSPEIA